MGAGSYFFYYSFDMSHDSSDLLSSELLRSPLLLSRQSSALLVVDVQTKLVPAIPSQHLIVWNICRLIDGANALEVPVVATEQYPQGLGSTVPQVAEKLTRVEEKIAFSCGACGPLFRDLQHRSIHQILVAGIEAHVCVMQTVLDLMTESFDVFVTVDAVGSRFDLDARTALERMALAGATLCTTESALFEWCGVAGTPEFKKISALVRQQAPDPWKI